MTDELLPGYFLEPNTGAWLTLEPWPTEGAPPTIGWDVIDWIEGQGAYEGLGLRDLRSEGRWRLTDGQVRFILWWYALDPESPHDSPRWLYSSGVKRGAKGTGKDPLLATLALAELCGPTKPVWNGSRWKGEAYTLALVQIGANSEGQAKDPMRIANALVDATLSGHYGFDKGITATKLDNGSQLEILTTSEASTEGDPATACFLNESHHMKEANGGQRLAAVARRNVAKAPGGLARVLEFTNCHMPGESSVAEDSFEAWQKQVTKQTRRRTILYDSREAPPSLSLYVEEELMLGLRIAYADAPWVDLERIRDEAQDPRIPIADSIRFYFNSLPTSEDAWVAPRDFDALADAAPLEKGQAVAMFLTCSKSENATALVACRIDDGAVFGLGCWTKGPKGSVPREEVDAAVMAAKASYDVQWFGVNPSAAREDDTEQAYWASMIDHWHREFRSVVLLGTVANSTQTGAKASSVLFDLRPNKVGGKERLREFTEVAEQTVLDIEENAALHWDGNAILRQHVHNARRRANPFGIGLGKRSRDSNKLVDYAVAMVGARMGRRRVLNSDKQRKKRTGRAMFVGP